MQGSALRRVRERRKKSDLHVIGLISDTHGLIRPQAIEALQGVELIIHAGDIGKPEVIERLERCRSGGRLSRVISTAELGPNFYRIPS